MWNIKLRKDFIVEVRSVSFIVLNVIYNKIFIGSGGTNLWKFKYQLILYHTSTKLLERHTITFKTMITSVLHDLFVKRNRFKFTTFDIVVLLSPFL